MGLVVQETGSSYQERACRFREQVSTFSSHSTGFDVQVDLISPPVPLSCREMDYNRVTIRSYGQGECSRCERIGAFRPRVSSS